MIRVLLADDNAVLREGVRDLLEIEGGIEVVGEAADGREAISLAAELQPDVLVMDVSMPHVGGLEAVQEIHAQVPTVNILLFSGSLWADISTDAIQKGARGFLNKENVFSDLVEAIHIVHSGRVYIPPSRTLPD